MQAFEAWLDDFFASYFRRRPVNATFIGMHAYDDCLSDFSENGMSDTLGDAEDLLRRLRALPRERLSDPQEMDRRLAEGFLHIQRWECTSAQFGAFSNPTLFTGEAIFGVIALLLPGQPPRLDAARARLEAVPAFLDVAMRQMRSAPAAWIERARRECQGATLLLRAVGRDFSGLKAAAEHAQQTLARFEAFVCALEATDDYAAGGQAFDLIMRAAHFADPDAVEQLALDRVAQEQEALRAPEPPSIPPPTPGEYLARFASLWHELRALAEQADLVTFPDWPIQFVERPTWAREAASYLYFLPYRSPPPYDHLPLVYYLVPPESDHSTIKLNHVVHHGGLGHQVQNWFAARARSRIGQVAAVDCAARIAMLCGGSMAEGWATYATDLVDELLPGFLRPAESYGLHRARLRMAARAIVDIRLHQCRFTLEQAIEFYTVQVGMPAAAARAEVVKNSLFPGAACMYLIGWDGIWRLRRALESRQGGAFRLRAFHDRLLSSGSVPVPLIAQAMLGTATVPALSNM
jgi:uncharacterized protein (DUF885 family)